MEFKGTKGKWEIFGSPFVDEELGKDSGPYSGTLDIKSGKTTVVGVPAYSFYNLTFEEAEANAKLISKAPEMLEMLNNVLDHLTPEFPESSQKLLLDEIKKLIKEATTIEKYVNTTRFVH